MQKIAIYDLDRTILKTPTFTSFLLFASRRQARSLILRAPVWICALIGYRLGLYSRKKLKQFGFGLFVGKDLAAEDARALGEKFARQVIPAELSIDAANAIARDRNAGCRMVMATAAPEIYAGQISRLLKFDDIIATRQMRTVFGGVSHLIDGENCYADEKLRRIKLWMSDQNLSRKLCHIRFYSDHPSDAPTLDFADEAVLVNQGTKMQMLADSKGWKLESFAS